MDMKTTYLGLELKHPIVASASPMSRTLDGIRRMEDAGASAIVMFSLFEEQIRYENEALDYLTEAGTETFAESLTYFPSVQDYRVGPDSYLELIRAASQACEVPIIASLNGVTSSGWTELCPRDDRGRRQSDRAQYLLHSRRPERSPGGRSSSAISTW